VWVCGSGTFVTNDVGGSETLHSIRDDDLCGLLSVVPMVGKAVQKVSGTLTFV